MRATLATFLAAVGLGVMAAPAPAKVLSYAKAESAVKDYIGRPGVTPPDATLVSVAAGRCLRQSRVAVRCFGEREVYMTDLDVTWFCGAFYRATLQPSGKIRVAISSPGSCQDSSQM